MRFAVAVLSFFDNENKIHIVEATNELEAMNLAMGDLNGMDTSCWSTPEQFADALFDQDIAISYPVLIDID